MFLFDSNILIYRLNDVLPARAVDQVEFWIAEGAYISVVTRIEVLGYPEQTANQARHASSLIRLFAEIPLREPIIQSAIGLRRRQSIRLGDAVIAATALQHELSIVTRNTGDFEWIESLQLVNPFEA